MLSDVIRRTTVWKSFKELFKEKFIPPAYYYREFTDLPCFHSDVVANLVEVLCRFWLDNKKKWRSLATTIHCTFYQEFTRCC